MPSRTGFPDVHQDHVGVVLADQADGFGAVPGFAQHLHVGSRPHHDHEAAAYQGLVVGDHHLDRHRAPSPLACISLVQGIGRGEAGRDAEAARVRSGG